MSQIKLLQNKTSVTEMVFILDRSGSMQGLELDTINGFNELIAKQKEEPGTAFVTTVLFDHKIETITDREPLSEVKPLTREKYYVRGCTALLDAVGSTIKKINQLQKACESRPDHTIFVITTDGYENASEHYSTEKVKRMIEKRKRKNNWEFIFLGANIDAVKTAASIGIDQDHASEYRADSKGTLLNYQVLSDEVLSCVRVGASFDGSWKDDIEEDLKCRS
ncbi:hypothetical protein AALA21_00600 [Eggerthellaceae bacterium 3-80]|nr:hypothetical protein D7W09_01715 [bacterium D16-34]